MARQSIEEKALGYLATGRVKIARVDGTSITATVTGSSVYVVLHGRGGWSCTCPARGRCCHLVACWLVTDTPSGRLALGRP